MQSKTLVVFGLWLATILSACGGGGGGGTPPELTLQSITVSLINPALQPGMTTTATAVASYSNGTTANVTSTATWSSDSPSATVNALGTITAVSAGTAVISARLGTTGGGAAVTVTVTPPPTLQSIVVTLVNSTVALGQNATATALGSYSNGTTANVTSTATWSSDSVAASVTSTGSVTSTAVGTANISATIGSVSGSAAFTVTAPSVTSISVTPDTGTVVTGGAPLQLTATGIFSNGTTANITTTVSWATPQTGCVNITSGGRVTSIIGAGNDCPVSIGASLGIASDSAQLTAEPAFLPGASLQIGVFQPTATALGDLNGDGLRDAMVASSWSNIVVSLRTGNGAFGSGTVITVDASSDLPRLGDFDRDGNLDMLVRNTSNVVLVRGNGAGGFPTQTNFAIVDPQPGALAIGDFNGDTFLDYALPSRSGNSVAIRLGNGAGNFGASNNFAAGQSPQAVEVGEFNGDGNADLVVRRTAGISVLLGNGSGAFNAPIDFALANAPLSLAITDLDNDGDQDLAIAAGVPTLAILLGDGTGAFQSSAGIPVGHSARGIAKADLNGDGRQDLVVVSPNSVFSGSVISLFYASGALTFNVPATIATGSGTSTLFPPSVADVSGDGQPDIVTSDAGNVGGVTAFINR
ncbi:MAG: FG-GAP-like repeat-containing protein [Steroidobacteraceae bacterium]